MRFSCDDQTVEVIKLFIIVGLQTEEKKYSFKKTGIADELCYLMFCQNKQKNEMLSPTTDCPLQHLKQSNYQAFVCSHALEAMQDLESLKGHG